MKPTIKDVAYEVLFQNSGRPMHVKDITETAIRMKLFDLLKGGLPQSKRVDNTVAAKLNAEIYSNQNDSRFERVGENIFKLRRFDKSNYEGGFRQAIESMKEMRRLQAANVGEINNVASPRPHIPSAEAVIRATSQPSHDCNKTFGPYDARISRLELIIQSELGFEERLLATAALRANDVTAAQKYYERIYRIHSMRS